MTAWPNKSLQSAGRRDGPSLTIRTSLGLRISMMRGRGVLEQCNWRPELCAAYYEKLLLILIAKETYRICESLLAAPNAFGAALPGNYFGNRSKS
jgi:hypothetical protein